MHVSRMRQFVFMGDRGHVGLLPAADYGLWQLRVANRVTTGDDDDDDGCDSTKASLSRYLYSSIIKNKGIPYTQLSIAGWSWSSTQGSQPAGDSMHGHEAVGGLPSPPTRPTATHMHCHKPGSRLPLLSARPAVTFPAVTALRSH